MRSLAVALLLLPPFVTATPVEDEKVNGYAEYLRDGAVIVEGQVVRAHAGTEFKGDGISRLDSIPLGYEVEAKGERLVDGTILAEEIEAKPNGDAMFESDVLEATNEIEREWVGAGRMYEPSEGGGEETIGRLLESGPHVTRVDGIMRRLTPPYVDYERQVRVHVVQTKEWNAAAMGNGAIWVYTGLIESMSDAELAIVLGHEMAHYTHEHSRRQAKTGMWSTLAALGAIVAGEVIGTDTSRAVAGIGALLGMTVWGSGYSRDLEDQADRVGLRYAHEGGFDVAAGVTLWGKFRERYGEPDTITNFFLGSHSRPSDRIRNIQREIDLNYPERSGAVSTSVAVGGEELPNPAPREEPSVSGETENEWIRQVRVQLDGYRDELPTDLHSVAAPEYGELEPDGARRHDVDFERGGAFFIVGACDNDCDDVDLAIYDPAGRSIAVDYESDDYPVLAFEVAKTGRWSLEVTMPGCDADTCIYGFEVYRNQ